MARPRPIEVRPQVVWVVGATRGIGREIAKQFASIGCIVCISGRSRRQLRSLVREITSLGGRAHDFPLDITHSVDILKVAIGIQKRIGEIDVLVNNAGVTVFKSFVNTTLEDFDEIIDTNLHGQIVCMKAVIPSMVKRRTGCIMNILSNAAIKTFEGSSAYSATKAGMLALSRVVREEMRKYNVRVISVLPGATETGMWSASDRARHGKKMMRARSVAEAVLDVYQMPEDLVVDEIVVRPMGGDIAS